MARCGNCGAESARVRSRWTDKGAQLPDQCPQCSPGDMEGKVTDPSDKKIWMGYEAHPNEYEKRYDDDGVFYIRKHEYRAEQEDQLRKQATDEIERQERAENKKRLERRTEPMSASEHIEAMAKARMIADAMQEAAQQAERDARLAEALSWITPAGHA